MSVTAAKSSQDKKGLKLPKIAAKAQKQVSEKPAVRENVTLPFLKAKTRSQISAASSTTRRVDLRLRSGLTVASSVNLFEDEAFLNEIEFEKQTLSGRRTGGRRVTVIRPNYTSVKKSLAAAKREQAELKVSLADRNNDVDELDLPELMRNASTLIGSMVDKQKIYYIPEQMMLKFTHLISRSKWYEASKLCKKFITLQPNCQVYREFLMLLQSLIILKNNIKNSKLVPSEPIIVENEGEFQEEGQDEFLEQVDNGEEQVTDEQREETNQPLPQEINQSDLPEQQERSVEHEEAKEIVETTVEADTVEKRPKSFKKENSVIGLDKKQPSFITIGDNQDHQSDIGPV